MEKHACKLCFRSFSNGRALGGHMRSHVAATAKAAAAAAAAVAAQGHKYTPSPSASLYSTTSSREEDDDDGKEETGIGYGLRENPRKSFRVVDPEFFAADAGISSVVVQDRESEAESSRAPPQIHRRRSKRARPSSIPPPLSVDTPEPVSSVSDNTSEEDVAACLMMLSRDTWKNKNIFQENDDEFDIDEEEERMMMIHQQKQKQKEKLKQVVVVKGRSKYQCGTCKKVFRSYQALGGHRASHKKFNSCFPPPSPSNGVQIHDRNADKVQHECPVCFRVFGSGQALGGHKRSHLTPSSTATITMTTNSSTSVPLLPPPRIRDSLIDLNLPAPIEDDAELSAVSDAAEFVLHHRSS